MIAKHMDRIVRGLQWPVAYSLACLCPLILIALALWIRRSTSYPVYATMFWLGALAMLAVSRSPWGSSKLLKTAIKFERKITQSILSFLLLQPTSTVLSWLKKKIPKLGTGRSAVDQPPADASNPAIAWPWLADDNWLIRTSPYFFPAASILLWLLSSLFLPEFLRSFVLGLGVSYHLLSVYVQLRSSLFLNPDANPDDTSSKNAKEQPLGYPKRFLWLFLIPMNLLVFTSGYAFALQGFAGLRQLLSDLTGPLGILWKSIASVMGIYISV